MISILACPESLSSYTHSDLSTFTETLGQVLGLVDSRRDQFLEERDLDTLRQGVRERKFCPIQRKTSAAKRVAKTSDQLDVHERTTFPERDDVVVNSRIICVIEI